MVQEARLKKPESVHEFQRMFFHIFGERNEQVYKKDDDLIRRLHEQTSRLLKYTRKDRRDSLREELAHVFSWTMAVVNRLDIDMQGALWYKYPGVCPYCLRNKKDKCACGLDHPATLEENAAELRRFRKEFAGREPQTLAEHQELHKCLYLWQHEGDFPITIAAHVSEEAGEVSEAHRFFEYATSQEDKDYWWGKICEELSDVLAWCFTLANRLDFDLAEAVWKTYPYECVKCHEGHCICKKTI